MQGGWKMLSKDEKSPTAQNQKLKIHACELEDVSVAVATIGPSHEYCVLHCTLRCTVCILYLCAPNQCKHLKFASELMRLHFVFP